MSKLGTIPATTLWRLTDIEKAEGTRLSCYASVEDVWPLAMFAEEYLLVLDGNSHKDYSGTAYVKVLLSSGIVGFVFESNWRYGYFEELT